MDTLIAPLGPLKLKFPLPSHWEEMTFKQFRELARFKALNVEPASYDIQFVKAICGAPKWLYYFFALDVILFQALPLVAWAKGENRHIKCFVPYLRTKWGRKLIGPSDKLGGITVAAFGFANAWLNAFTAKPTEENLNKFIASLYTTSGEFDGGKGWNRAVKKASRVRFEDKLLAAINYSGMVAALPLSYKVTYENHTQTSSAAVDWEVTIMGFTGEMPWEKSKVENASITTILAWIEGKNIAAKETQKQIDNNKK